jgi:hypothetical protein
VTENVARTLTPHRQQATLGLLGLAVAVAAAAVAILLIRGHRHTTALPAPNAGPTLVSQAQLEQLAASSKEPVYWAGPRSGYSYELTRTSNGRIFIRYLPPGARAGDPRADFLVVGTYTQPGSFADLKRAGRRPGALSLRIDNGGLVVFSSSKPTSVYFSYPGARYQVEVYAPSGDTARGLALGGKIRPIR